MARPSSRKHASLMVPSLRHFHPGRRSYHRLSESYRAESKPRMSRCILRGRGRGAKTEPKARNTLKLLACILLPKLRICE
jgi:hypothetical protein